MGGLRDLLSVIALMTWIVVGVATLIAMAPTTSEPSTKNEPTYEECATLEKYKTTFVWVVLCRVDVVVHRNRDDIAAISTFFIALFTIALVFVTRKLAEATVIAAVAAKDAAEALPILERGRLYAEIRSASLNWMTGVTQTHPETKKQTISNTFRIEIVIRNHGKTPSVVKKIQFGNFIGTAPVGDLEYTFTDDHIIAVIGANDEADPIFYKETVEIETVQELVHFFHSGEAFWIYGSVDYTDIFEKQHTHRFLRKAVKKNMGYAFQSFDYKHYNLST
jgi:hypothetical protein